MIQMLVQVAAGSCDRKIYNERTLEYLETQPGSRAYPYPYGFIIGTSAADGANTIRWLFISYAVFSFMSVVGFATNTPITAGAFIAWGPILIALAILLARYFRTIKKNEV